MYKSSLESLRTLSSQTSGVGRGEGLGRIIETSTIGGGCHLLCKRNENQMPNVCKLLLVKRFIGLGYRTRNALCFLKITHLLLKICQRMKPLQNKCA